MKDVPWRRPLRKLRPRREVLEALADYPEEILNYRRVFWELISWVLLVVASVCALLDTVL